MAGLTVDNLLAHKLNSVLKVLSLLVKQQNQNIHVWMIMWQLRVQTWSSDTPHLVRWHNTPGQVSLHTWSNDWSNEKLVNGLTFE
ncbi:uncharacterized protein LOC135109069 isoform X2 [Scylla paramamosain]|uniref:uncharacterized protein LOC135109069 isoform X2 n=1 Tax=Scylla paramamosain TaxID=85552 RepID=UPI0030838FFA